jgi:hypothetical protein
MILFLSDTSVGFYKSFKALEHVLNLPIASYPTKYPISPDIDVIFFTLE